MGNGGWGKWRGGFACGMGGFRGGDGGMGNLTTNGHEWGTNGEGSGNGRDEGEGGAGGLFAEGGWGD